MKMKPIYIFFMTALYLVSFAPNVLAEFGILGSAGLPRGYMDVSFNVSLYCKMNVGLPVMPELMIGNSLARKSTDPGYVASNVTSGYLLADFSPDLSGLPLKPFIAAGGGLHMIYSFSGDNSPVCGKSGTALTGKGHIFFGTEYYPWPKIFFAIFGRLTFPGDKALDSGYLGLGIRL